MLAWMKARQSNLCKPGTPVEGQKEEDPAAAAIAAKVVCEARLEQVRCELEVERLEEGKKERERKEQERLARERDVRTWRAEEAQRRKDREARWQAFWKNKRKRREAQGGVTGTLAALTLGIPAVLALLIYALTVPDGKWGVFSIGLLTAASAFAVGALLGFLFGIPRSVAASTSAPDEAAGEKKPAAEPAAAKHFSANTNLEQISDWLTKILVGVGLVQIHQVSGAIEDLANGLGPGLGPQGFTVAVALHVPLSITGFVSAYLFTRLRLQGEFELATVIDQAVEERADTETSAIA